MPNSKDELTKSDTTSGVDSSTTKSAARGAPKKKRGIKLLLKKLALAVASLVFTLIIVEVAMRMTMPPRLVQRDPRVQYKRYERDPEKGVLASYWTLQPNQEGYHLDAPVKVDRLGFRNDQIREDLPSDHVRIIALGDSHTFGFAIANKDTWPRQLEQRLQSEMAGQSIDVINGGIEALAIEQELQSFEDHLLSLKPQIVILAYYWNDMPTPGNPDAPWPKENGPIVPPSMKPAPAKAADQGNKATATKQGIIDSLRKTAKESYLIYYTFQSVPGLQMAIAPQNLTIWKRAILTGRVTPRIESSWEFVDTQLLRFRKLADKYSFQPVVVIVPIFEQMTTNGYGNTGYQDVVTRLGNKHGITVVDPLGTIRAIEPSYPGDFVPFDGHPTGRIYGAIADELVKSIKKNSVLAETQRESDGE